MTVTVKGITYDTGCEIVAGRRSRPIFDEVQVAREMAVIATDLHCNAVRLTGNDPDRLSHAARLAADVGLQVWLSPVAHDRPAQELLAVVERTGAVAADLRREGHDVVLVAGWESSVFVPGMISGRTTVDRLGTLGSIPRLLLSTLRHGSFQRRLNEHLGDAVRAARRTFDGPVTYAAAMWEEVDWSRFDIVGVDAYRNRPNAARFPELIKAYSRHGKPVAALEFGCCTHRGAADLGALGWRVADPVARSVRPGVVRDEAEQARYLADVYQQLCRAGVSATFPFTFASYSYPTLSAGPDLDVGAYGLVRCFEVPQEDGRYAGMPWRPKEAFGRLASLYADAAALPQDDALKATSPAREDTP